LHVGVQTVLNVNEHSVTKRTPVIEFQ